MGRFAVARASFFYGPGDCVLVLGGLASNVFGFGGAAIGGFSLVYGVLHLLVGVGLLRLAEWARVLAVALAAINLAFTVLRLLAPFFFFFAFRRLFVCAVDVLILWYLRGQESSRDFRARTRKPKARRGGRCGRRCRPSSRKILS